MTNILKSVITNQEAQKFAAPNGLKFLFNPHSIAIIGASGSASIGMTTAPLEYLLKYKYKGKIFPVNPKYTELKGLKCYPSLAAISEKIDVALVLTPEKTVFEHLENCGKKGVKGVIVIASGFAETGEEGLKKQLRLKALAEKYGFVLLGPNCVGLVNVVKGIPITFASGLSGERLKPGKIGLVSQSGALLSSIVSRAQEWGIGFSYVVGMGNEAKLDLTDCLRFMVEDPHTEVIMALIEGIKDVKKFFSVANLAMEKKKPIVVLKLGASEAGRSCAATHTGNLAGAFPVYLGSFRQKKILVANGINDFILSARTFLQVPLPKGEGIGVVTSSGGGAGMIADVIQQEGLRLGNLSPQSIQKLSAVMPWYGTPKNPFDFAGQKNPVLARTVYQIFLQDPDIHILLLVVHTQSNKETFINELTEAGKKFNKPIAVLYLGGTLAPAMDGLMSREDLPFFVSPQECIKALGNLICYSRYLKKTEDIFPIDSLKKAKTKALKVIMKSEKQITEAIKENILSCYSIRSVRQKLASSSAEAVHIASSFGYPVALKIASSDILHKTEFKGVELNIHNSSEVKQAYKRMYARFYKDTPDFNLQGMLVQEMVTDQVAEVIVGITQDPQFGPTIMFGLGGIMAELLGDVSFRICPLNPSDAREMIREIKGYQVLNGFRGKPKADVAALEKALVRLSRLAVDLNESMHEIEINPLMVFAKGKGVKAADTTFLLR
jgi:acyl-CoA synthetase (NDP forming)